jgi:hypothetical protein
MKKDISPCIDCPEKYYCEDICPQFEIYADEGNPPEDAFKDDKGVVRIAKVDISKYYDDFTDEQLTKILNNLTKYEK